MKIDSLNLTAPKDYLGKNAELLAQSAPDAFADARRSLAGVLAESVIGVPWPSELKRVRAETARFGDLVEGASLYLLKNDHKEGIVVEGIKEHVSQAFIDSFRIANTESRVHRLSDEARLMTKSKRAGRILVPLVTAGVVVETTGLTSKAFPAITGATAFGFLGLRELNKQIVIALARKASDKTVSGSLEKLFTKVSPKALELAKDEVASKRRDGETRLTMKDKADILRQIEVEHETEKLVQKLRSNLHIANEKGYGPESRSRLLGITTANFICHVANVRKLYV